MWSAEGATRFLAYSAVFWCAAALLLWRAPRYFAPAAAAFVFLYTSWWTGIAAPLAVLYFLGSAYCLGRRLFRESDSLTATMAGTAAWMLVIQLVLRVPVNTTPVYLGLFALPYLRRWKWKLAPLPPSSPALALLTFVVLAHWLVALKPDVSSDGLSMHLALPSIVADRGHWPFDFQNYIWAVMPAAADALYAGVYLLGGEAAARLLNFAYLALTVAMMAQVARRWVSLNHALVGAALFASTPLVQLVTGALFIENAWTALIVAALLPVLRYYDSPEPRELTIAAVITGSALASKLIAAAYAAPLLLAVGVLAIRRGHGFPAIRALALCALLAAPPYATAWIRTDNPIFPFSNAIFKSPHYYTDKSFDDSRYHAPLTWRTPYNVTFHSEKYMEGQAGASGFQFLFLLLPALLLVRRRDQALTFACGAFPALLILAALPNLRYLYPSLAVLSVFLSSVRLPPALLIAFTGLNLWFLPSSNFYHADFALFRKSEIGPFLERLSPARPLIEHLNRAAPGEPVAFFGTDTIAELHAPAYSDNWHSEHYWKRVRESNARNIAAYLTSLGIRHVVAPLSREAQFRGVREFLRRWVEPDGPTSGTMGVFRVRTEPLPVERDPRPLGPGVYEDSDERIEYSENWINDHQFREATAASVSYSDMVGESVKLRFQGEKLVYSFTRALNRGIAEVKIDGQVVALVDAYLPQTQWQASREFSVSPGEPHTFEISVTGRKDPRSSGTFVDLDKIEIH